MSTVYAGNGTIPNPTVPQNTRRAIVSSTNAAPIVLQITGHGYNTGDTIEVEGHLVNTAANGLFTITVPDVNHVALNGTTGNGVGGATGYTIDYEIQPAITIPSGGDLVSAATLNPTLEGAQNLAPFLYRRDGVYRFHATYNYKVSTVAYNSSWNLYTAPDALEHAITGSSVSGQQALYSFTGLARDPSFLPTDIIEIEWYGSFTCADTGGHVAQGLVLGLAVQPGGGSFIFLDDAQQSFSADNGASIRYQGFHLHSMHTMSDGIINQSGPVSLNFALTAILPSFGTSALTLFGPSSILVKQYRKN